MTTTLPFQRQYRLLDVSLRLRTTNASDADLIQNFLQHLSIGEASPVDTVFELIRLSERYLLRQDGRSVDECTGRDGVIPMVHAALLLAAYRGTGCFGALHAAAVTRKGRCVLMPGISGSGKSTLTAALLACGFHYCTDDLVLLSGDPIRIRSLPMRLGLKEGAWSVLTDRWPEICDLPVYRRADGKRIRYALPQRCPSTAAHQDAYRVTHAVFPCYSPGGRCELESIGAGDALLRLTQAGYDLPNRIDRDIVARLVEWLSAIPCYDLRFEDLDDAIDAVSGLVS